MKGFINLGGGFGGSAATGPSNFGQQNNSNSNSNYSKSNDSNFKQSSNTSQFGARSGLASIAPLSLSSSSSGVPALYAPGFIQPNALVGGVQTQVDLDALHTRLQRAKEENVALKKVLAGKSPDLNPNPNPNLYHDNNPSQDVRSSRGGGGGSRNDDYSSNNNSNNYNNNNGNINNISKSSNNNSGNSNNSHSNGGSHNNNNSDASDSQVSSAHAHNLWKGANQEVNQLNQMHKRAKERLTPRNNEQSSEQDRSEQDRSYQDRQPDNYNPRRNSELPSSNFNNSNNNSGNNNNGSATPKDPFLRRQNGPEREREREKEPIVKPQELQDLVNKTNEIMTTARKVLDSNSSNVAKVVVDRSNKKKREVDLNILQMLAKLKQGVSDGFRTVEKLPLWRLKLKGVDTSTIPPDSILRGAALWRVIAKAIVGMYCRPLVSYKRKRIANKALSMPLFNKTLVIYVDVCASWLAKLLKIPLASIGADKTLDFEPLTSRNSKGIIQLKVRLRSAISALEAIDSPPIHILDFLCELTKDGVYFPDHYFWDFEGKTLRIDQYGAVRNLDGLHEDYFATVKRLIKYFLLVRVLIDRVILMPWLHGFCPRVIIKGRKYFSNYRIIAGLIYECLRSKENYLPEIDKQAKCTIEAENEQREKERLEKEKHEKEKHEKELIDKARLDKEELEKKSEASNGASGEVVTDPSTNLPSSFRTKVGNSLAGIKELIDGPDDVSSSVILMPKEDEVETADNNSCLVGFSKLLSQLSWFQDDDDKDDREEISVENNKKNLVLMQHRDMFGKIQNIHYFLRSADDFKAHESVVSEWIRDYSKVLDDKLNNLTEKVIATSRAKREAQLRVE